MQLSKMLISDGFIVTLHTESEDNVEAQVNNYNLVTHFCDIHFYFCRFVK